MQAATIPSDSPEDVASDKPDDRPFKGFAFPRGNLCRIEGCGKRFPTSADRRRHERRVHEQSIPP